MFIIWIQSPVLMIFLKCCCLFLSFLFYVSFSHIFMNLGTDMLWEGPEVLVVVSSIPKSSKAMNQILHQRSTQTVEMLLQHNQATHQVRSIRQLIIMDILISCKRKSGLFQMAIVMTMEFRHLVVLNPVAVSKEDTISIRRVGASWWTNPHAGLLRAIKKLLLRWMEGCANPVFCMLR